MKFTIQSKTLLTHLSAVSKVVNTKSTISILENFLFTLKNGVLIVTGTDQENTITTRIELLQSEGEGSFAVNVKKMLELLKELPDQGFTFEVNDNTFEINIHYLNGEYKFVGIDGREYPQKEQMVEDTLEMHIPAEEITKSLEKTVFAVGTDPLRPVMTGVLWDIKPDEIRFVASDTHKLVRYVNNRVATGYTSSFIMPAKPANVLLGILSKEEENVKVVLGTKTVSFETNAYTLTTQQINGKYPDYNAVIPRNNPYEVTVDRAMLLTAIRRVAIFAAVGGLVSLEITNNQIMIRVQDVKDSTSAEEIVSCEYSGDRIVIGFNKDKIIEVLSNISVDNIYFKVSDPARPGLFVPVEQAENEDWIGLLMPMMVANS